MPTTFEHWNGILASERPSPQLQALADAGELNAPELRGIIGIAQDPKAHPEGDVWIHTLLVVDNAAATKKKVPAGWRVPYLFAALLHDTGKQSMDAEKDPHYSGHASESVGLVADFMARIGAPDDVVVKTMNLVRWHHSPFDMKEDDLEQWRVIRVQVPLAVLAWFSRCDSFAGARRNEPPALAVHAASERTFRVEKVLAAQADPPSA